jgi:hypothetical protein
MRILNQDFFDMSANTMEYSPSTCLPGFAGQACYPMQTSTRCMRERKNGALPEVIK